MKRDSRRLPGYSYFVAIICVSCLLAGCSLFAGSDSNSQPAAEPTFTPGASAPATGTPATEGRLPSMPGCGAGPGCATPPASSAGQPVVQASTAITPFVIYDGGKLADGWQDASYG